MTENFYITRIQMSIYINLFKKYINAKFEPIFKSSVPDHVESDAGSDMPDHLYHEFLQSVNGGGVNKTNFLKNAIRLALVQDVAFICMDKIDTSIHPYIFLKSAVNVIDYTTDPMGALTSICFVEPSIEIDGKIFYRRRYIGLDRFAIQRSEDKKRWTDERFSQNVLGMLPVYPLFTTRPDDLADYKPRPSNYEIAGYCAWLYDKGSKLDYLINKQAHSLLVMQGNITSIPNGVDNALIIDESEKSVFQPQYLSPSEGMPTVHQTRIDSVMNTMMDLMQDSGVSVTQIAQPESGIAKSYRFAATNDVLKSMVRLLVDLDNWLVDTYKLFTGDEGNWKSYSEYPSEFAPTVSLTVDDMIRLSDFFGMETLPLNQADVLIKLRHLIDPMATKEDSQMLYDEINNRTKVAD